MGGLGSSGHTLARYGLEILYQCDKMVRNKSQKVLRTNFYVCRSYRGKYGRREPFRPE